MADYEKIAKTSDILPGEIKSFVVGIDVIAVCNVEGNFYAIKDRCTHEEYPLSDGDLEGEVITCVYHGAEFNVKTGERLCLPATEDVETYEIKIEGDDIYVLIED